MYPPADFLCWEQTLLIEPVEIPVCLSASFIEGYSFIKLPSKSY